MRRTHERSATNLVVRVPRALDARLDDLAAGANPTKSEIVRFWLLKLSTNDLPEGWHQDAAALRAARLAR